MERPPVRSRAPSGGSAALALLVVCFWISGALPGPSASGEEWPILGARAMGMGGAGVAAARGGQATYWNPAALARSGTARRLAGGQGESDGLVVNGSGGLGLFLAAPGGTLRDLDRLHDDVQALDIPAIEAKISAGTPLTPAEIQLALRILGQDLPALGEPGKGLLLNAIGGPTFQLERFGLALLATVHAGATVNVDLVNLALGDQGIDFIVGAGQDRSGQLSASGQSLADQIFASSGGAVTQNQAEEFVFQAEQGGTDTSSAGARSALQAAVDATVANDGGTNANSITNNQSGATVRGLFLQELAVGYGHPVGGWLALGVAAKAMHAFTYSQAFSLRNTPASSDLPEELLDIQHNDESTPSFGVDAGVLLTPLPGLALGVTGKNLNRPAFRQEGAGHFVLEPNARAGAAISLGDWITVAADLDLFHNRSDVLPGYRSQMIGGGAQLDLGVLELRAGVSKNLLDPDEDPLLHAGLALQIGPFNLEAAAAVTPDLQGIEAGGGGEIPERAGASLTLGFNIDF